MATGQLNRVLRHLHKVARLTDTELSDAELLERYLARRDEAAFEALVRRHGPMVLGVCRRVLKNAHDAEDAFQATFLVLVKKAASIRPRHMVGNWLYGVACRTAAKARTLHAKRRAKELAMPSKDARAEDFSPEIQALLDQELCRLPDKYRAPLVLCDLEGQTRKDAARRLGWPEGTVATRLVRARTMLAKRLARHRGHLSITALAVAALQCAASAKVPTPLVLSTVKAATEFAAGHAGSAAVAAVLAQGVLKSMLITKLRVTSALLLLAAALTLALGAGSHEAPAAQPSDSAPAKKAPRAASVATPVDEVRGQAPGSEPLAPGVEAPPRPALISLDDKGHLAVRYRTLVYIPVTTISPAGDAAFTSCRAEQRTHVSRYNLAKTKVYDTSGKPVPVKQALKPLMKGELLALVAQHEPVDPLHLRLVKEDTLVFVLPESEEGPGVPPPAPAARTPIVPPPLAPANQLVMPPALPPPPAPQAAARPARVAQIVIVGNESTPERVIRQATGLLPGAVLTFEDLRAAEKNLAKLNLFQRATVAVLNDGNDEFRDIVVTVMEKHTPASRELKKLQGTWIVESLAARGTSVKQTDKREFVFKDNTLTVGGNPGAVLSFKLDVSRKPALMELVVEKGEATAAPKFVAYEVVDDTLRLSIPESNTATPPNGFGENGQAVMTLKRKN